MVPSHSTWNKSYHRVGTCSLLSIVILCLLQIGSFEFASAELLESPSLRWSFSLEGGDVNTVGLSGRSLRQGNAVVASRGGDKLFVTADDASLHILNIAGAEPITAALFQPELVANTFTECRSGVVVVERTTSSGTVVPYLIYAVLDIPSSSVGSDGAQAVQSDNSESTNSRVIAVNMDGTLRWSVAVEGTIVGTPVVGSNGRLIYVSHNDSNNKGFLSVILSTEQGTVAELTASLSPEGRDAPFGPPALQQTPGQEESTNGDLVAVAESWDDGFMQLGGLYMLLPSADFEDTGGRGPTSYQLAVISQSVWSLSAVMAPLFVDSSLWIGGTSAVIAGWTNNRDLANVLDRSEEDVNPEWLFALTRNPENMSQPLLITPEISPDGSELFVVGAARDVYSIRSQDGRVSWTIDVESAVVNRPAYFTSDTGTANILYLIESMDGRVRQIDTDSGNENWQFSCVDVTGLDSCQNSVEAEFSIAESGNAIYYGDIFGRIFALEVAAFATTAPTEIPSSFPTLAPSIAPSLSASPTTMPVAIATILPTVPPVTPTVLQTASPTVFSGVILAPSVFDNANSALGAETGGDDDTDDMSMGLIIGVAVAGLVVASLVVFFVARTLLRPQKKIKTKETLIKIDDSGGDVEADLGSSGEDESDGGEYDDMDDITVTSGSDVVEVEVTVGAQLYQTPPKKTRSRKKKKKLRTPPTATTLASIQEAEDEELAALHNDAYPKADLNEKFRSTVDNKASSVEKGSAGRSDYGHVELSVGLNNLRPLVDDMSAGSDEDSLPPPPPPGRVTPSSDVQNHPRDVEEEKKDVDFMDGENPGTLSPQPSFGMTSDPQTPNSPAQSAASATSFIASVAAALALSPKKANTPRPLSPAPSATSQLSSDANSTPGISMSPSMMSTDSSLYTDDKSRLSTDRLSPLSTGIFGNDQGSLPDDEALAIMPPSLHHTYDGRDSGGGIRAPGAHYLSKGTALRPKFKPSGASQVPKVKSARTKRNLNGFSGSYLQSEDSGGEDDDESRIKSKASLADPKKPPTFKRRSKRDEAAPSATNMIEDTWNSFLKDLAAAEQQFFSPTHAQKSAVLRYNKDDDDTTLSAPIDDDAATVRTGSV